MWKLEPNKVKRQDACPSSGKACNMIIYVTNCLSTHMRESLWVSEPQEKLLWELEVNHKTQICKKPEFVGLECVRDKLSNLCFSLPALSLYGLIPFWNLLYSPKNTAQISDIHKSFPK